MATEEESDNFGQPLSTLARNNQRRGANPSERTTYRGGGDQAGVRARTCEGPTSHCYAATRILMPWLTGQQSSGGRATPGRSCSGCSPGTRRSRSSTSPPTPTPATGSPTSTRAWSRRTPISSSIRSSRATSTASTSPSWPCPTASRSATPATLVDRVAHLVDIGADFRLPGRRAIEQWYGETHTGAGTASTASSSACQNCSARLRRPRPRRQPGLLPDGGVARPGTAAGRRPGRAHRADRRRRLRHLRPGPGPFGPQPLQRGQRERRRLRAPHPPAHGRDGAGPRPAQPDGLRFGAVHPPPRPDDQRHPGHLLRPPHAEAAALGTDGLLARYRDFYAGEPFVAVLDQPPGHQGHRRRATPSTSPSGLDARTNTVLAIAAEDNLVKGASGQALQNANLLLGLPETLGLPTVGVDAVMSVTAAQGFVAAGVAAGIKAVRARPTCRWSPPPTTGRSPPPACSPPTWWPPPPSSSAAATWPATAGPPPWSSTPATPTPPPASPGWPSPSRPCALVADGLGCDRRRRPRLLHRPHRDPACRSTRSEPAVPAAVGRPRRPSPTRAASAAPAIMTTDTVAKEAVATAFEADGHHRHGRRDGQGRRHALAGHGHDAGRHHHRRRRRAPGSCRRRCTRAVDGSFNLMTTDGSRSTNDTVLVLASGAAGNQPLTGGDLEATPSPRPSPPSAPASPTRWPTTPRAPPSSSGSHVRGARSDPDARRRPGPSPRASSSSARCTAATRTGAGSSPRLGASGALPRARPGRHRLQRHHRLRGRRGRRRHDAEAVAKSDVNRRDIEIVCDLHLGNGDATVTTVDLTPGYIDENMRTS